MHINTYYLQGYSCLGDIVYLPGEASGMIFTMRDIHDMPDDELDNHIRVVVDRWTWDTGSTHDKKMLGLLEGEKQRRADDGFRVERVKTNQGVSTIRRVPID